MPLDISNFDTLIDTCNRSWSPRLYDLIIAIIVNILWMIWRYRNNVSFNDDFSNGAHNHFGVHCHPPLPPSIKQVNWIMPLSFWVKCNINGASRGPRCIFFCGGIISDHFNIFFYGNFYQILML
jgi:hypothetical protein